MFLIFEKKNRFLQAANADLKWKFWRKKFPKLQIKERQLVLEAGLAVILSAREIFKNGVYIMLVKDAGDAFGRSRFVKIDCKGLDPGDYKKLGSKHKNDFACVKVLIWEFYGYWFAKICVIHGVF
ncbi:hypothetical protein MTR_7g039560 [Medicago truncatula]|uniref:Uncharacterized protein n=1 Tax=Medicago truncatula TaxID=3880 RepID=A0A072TY29_MEDTR|nr:hypothetical protein MTR_7g039560 [Medicago truncatula]